MSEQKQMDTRARRCMAACEGLSDSEVAAILTLRAERDALRAEVERLREALRKMLAEAESQSECNFVSAADMIEARAVLGGQS